MVSVEVNQKTEEEEEEEQEEGGGEQEREQIRNKKNKKQEEKKVPIKRPLKSADDECRVHYPQKPQGDWVKTVASLIRCVWTDCLVVVSHFRLLNTDNLELL